jgi:FtsP/CotA-like multicopper oxidase with cupredoxin domain
MNERGKGMLGRKRLQRLAALAATLVFTAACSSATSDSKDAGNSGTELTIELQDIKLAPSSLIGPADAAFTIQVKNTGKVVHNLQIAAGDQTLKTPDLQPGGTATIDVPALETGQYDMWCGVPGHKEAGMAGILNIGNAASGEGGSANGGMQGMTAQQMADMDKATTSAFPQETEGTGNQPLKPTIEKGVKVFDIEAAPIKWETSKGEFVDAYAYNGQIPGPQIRVHQGDKVQVNFTNNIPEPSTIHFHGLNTPNSQDGVPWITQDPVMPSETFTYHFTVKDEPGTYMYHSHFDAASQVDKGLLGTFVVEPKGKPTWDTEATVVIGDGALGFNLNGKSFPATAPIVAKKGDSVLIRLVNEGQMIHPMHLHGFHMLVVNQDGQALAQPYTADTLMIAPGQRFDVLVDANKKGIWAFHCHILTHVEGPTGMFGMVTALIVE